MVAHKQRFEDDVAKNTSSVMTRALSYTSPPSPALRLRTPAHPTTTAGSTMSSTSATGTATGSSSNSSISSSKATTTISSVPNGTTAAAAGKAGLFQDGQVGAGGGNELAWIMTTISESIHVPNAQTWNRSIDYFQI